MFKYTPVKIITAAIATIALSNTAFAQQVAFKKLDDSLETQACYTAAKQGRDAAIDMLKENGVRVLGFERQLTCNGLTLTSFAKKYAAKAKNESGEVLATVKLVARKDNVASKVCLDAVTLGYGAALKKHDVFSHNVSCNDKSLREFVDSFEDTNVIVQNSAD